MDLTVREMWVFICCFITLPAGLTPSRYRECSSLPHRPVWCLSSLVSKYCHLPLGGGGRRGVSSAQVLFPDTL